MREPEDELATLHQEGLLRSLRSGLSSDQLLSTSDGLPVVNFSSNDYLGLSRDEALVNAACEATGRYGTGAGASRLISGSLLPHRDLEERIAEWKGTEAALTFANGYATAMGALGAFLTSGDVVIMDKLCHACLIDGARRSGATLRIFPHNNLDKLENLLGHYRKKISDDSRLLVVTESVFSMDGDRAPLAEISSQVSSQPLLAAAASAWGLLPSRRVP